MNIWRSLSGMVEVELTSADLPRALAGINDLGIGIHAIQWKDELTCLFRIQRRSYRSLKVWAEKHGESLSIHRRLGLFWLGKSLAKRLVLIVGVLMFALLSAYLPNRILFVRVEGNHRVPDSVILEAAENQGVYFGVSRRELRSERIKNGILSHVPQLQWVGVNTSGCVATVSVRERTLDEQERNQPTVSKIIAVRDGYILSGTVERGTAMFQEGQTVQQGQTLISGYVNSDFCIRAVRAEGEVIAQTNRSLTVVTPSVCRISMEDTKVKRRISLLLRKKRINLWKDSGISLVTCGRMYEEYYITLPGGFRLPAALCVETYIFRDLSESEQDRSTAGDQLRAFSNAYLQKQMIAGSIRNCAESLQYDNGCYLLRGDYICIEMIGREEPEQIGVTNGKNN